MGENGVSIPLKTSNMYNYYRTVFNKYDRDKDGFIVLEELIDMVNSREYINDIPDECVHKMQLLHDVDRNKKLDFDEFYALVTNPQYHHIFGHYLTRYINWVVPKLQHPSRTVTDGEYEDEYSCYPPAVGMIIISIIEIIFFLIDEFLVYDSTKTASGPTAQWFIYDPYNRREIWRFMTYMFVHIGAFHLMVNLLVQILLGIPLEMVHKWWRVLTVYFAGVLCGSLFTSIVDPTVKLAGASGGVYSLLTAHVASIIMNWREMSFPAAQLMIFLLVAISDVGTAIYNRYVLDVEQHIGYAAHFAGALAGLLVGINVLRNLNVTKTERVVWWISMVAFFTLIAVFVIWNLAWQSYFPKEMMFHRQILRPYNKTTMNYHN